MNVLNKFKLELLKTNFFVFPWIIATSVYLDVFFISVYSVHYALILKNI